jgi:hypothetical protein
MESIMQASNLAILYSDDFQQLQCFFQATRPPYNLEDINGFNAIYKRIYPGLNREERRRSEEWVDLLVDNVERKEWAARIFGVV